MFHLEFLTDYGLLFLRIMVGLIFFDSGYNDIRNPDARAKDLGLPKAFTVFLAIAELVGGAGLILGVLQQLAAIGCVLIMLGALQKKIFVWKSGFWGSGAHPGWYYELTITSMLLVTLFTDGGRFVILP